MHAHTICIYTDTYVTTIRGKEVSGHEFEEDQAAGTLEDYEGEKGMGYNSILISNNNKNIDILVLK